MAIEIVGKPEDVKKYREILHAKGQYTKWYIGEVTARSGVTAPKPDDYRCLTASITPISKSINDKGEIEVKEVSNYNSDEKLLIRGIANANIVDRMSERLEPAGVDVKNFMKNRVLLSDHMYMNQAVIGRVEELRVEDDGVHFDAFIGDPKAAPLTNLQKDIRSLVAQRLIQTVSVGFIPTRIKAPVWDDEGRLVEPAVIEKWELLELSVVAVPANPGATFEMRSGDNAGIALNVTASQPTQELTEVKNQLDNDKSAIDNLKGYEMDEKTAQDLVESVKTMVTLLGSLSSTVERSVSLNETILGHLESKGKKPSDKPADMPCEDDGCNKPKKDAEGEFDAKSAVDALQKDVEQLKSQLVEIAEILKALVDR